MATIRERADRARPWQAIVRRMIEGKTVNRTRSFLTKKEAETWARNVESAIEFSPQRG